MVNELLCCICTNPLTQPQTRKFPDYYCSKCFDEYVVDKNTGEPTPDKELPEWVRALMLAEKSRRFRQMYWRKRGFELIPTPFSQLKLRSKTYLSDAEHLESLGRVVGTKD